MIGPAVLLFAVFFLYPQKPTGTLTSGPVAPPSHRESTPSASGSAMAGISRMGQEVLACHASEHGRAASSSALDERSSPRPPVPAQRPVLGPTPPRQGERAGDEGRAHAPATLRRGLQASLEDLGAASEPARGEVLPSAITSSAPPPASSTLSRTATASRPGRERALEDAKRVQEEVSKNASLGANVVDSFPWPGEAGSLKDLPQVGWGVWEANCHRASCCSQQSPHPRGTPSVGA